MRGILVALALGRRSVVVRHRRGSVVALPPGARVRSAQDRYGNTAL